MDLKQYFLRVKKRTFFHLRKTPDEETAKFSAEYKRH